MYRFRCSEAAGEPEQTFLHEVLPPFVTNVIVKVNRPVDLHHYSSKFSSHLASNPTSHKNSVRSTSSTQCNKIYEKVRRLFSIESFFSQTFRILGIVYRPVT